MRIARCWSITDTQVDVLTWLRGFNLTQWQQLFSASIAELRVLLEFCRDQKGGPAAELLINGTTSIRTETDLDELPSCPASIRPIETVGLSTFGIWVNDVLTGKIPARDQSDIQAIILSGLEYSTAFSVLDGVGTLQLDLANPENF
jgi:hypothetical protein